MDLVTLDDLSAAAMLESSGRIEALAGVFAGAHSAPEPPPPVPLPAPVTRANVAVQAFALLEWVVLWSFIYYNKFQGFTILQYLDTGKEIKKIKMSEM